LNFSRPWAKLMGMFTLLGAIGLFVLALIALALFD
jgi:hypothetical protein